MCDPERRDTRCGRWGTLLHIELAARATDVRIWHCSHTGGHRFAPTAITLPDGRAWAYVDADVEVTRALPVPVRWEPPERATKSSPELALRRLDLTQ